MIKSLPVARSVASNPDQEEMREWVLELMPRVSKTEFGNLNYEAGVTARLSRSTFFVTDDESNPQNTMSPAEAATWPLRRTPTLQIRT